MNHSGKLNTESFEEFKQKALSPVKEIVRKPLKAKETSPVKKIVRKPLKDKEKLPVALKPARSQKVLPAVKPLTKTNKTTLEKPRSIKVDNDKKPLNKKASVQNVKKPLDGNKLVILNKSSKSKSTNSLNKSFKSLK